MFWNRRPALLLGLIALACPALAAEIPIEKPVQRDGLEIAAVYLQPIEMSPPGHMRSAADSDIHLEADVRALAANPNGFAEGAWVPYLVVHYELSKHGLNETRTGTMMPMVASDGPHYGDNVKLMGPGRYRLKLLIAPPGESSHFGRHVDKETGVAAWFAPFDVSYEFVFAGTGKKGAY